MEDVIILFKENVIENQSKYKKKLNYLNIEILDSTDIFPDFMRKANLCTCIKKRLL